MRHIYDFSGSSCHKYGAQRGQVIFLTFSYFVQMIVFACTVVIEKHKENEDEQTKFVYIFMDQFIPFLFCS